MARFLIEIEDMPGGEMRVNLQGDDLATIATIDENSPTQNAAILLIKTLREVGIGGEQLSKFDGV